MPLKLKPQRQLTQSSRILLLRFSLSWRTTWKWLKRSDKTKRPQVRILEDLWVYGSTRAAAFLLLRQVGLKVIGYQTTRLAAAPKPGRTPSGTFRVAARIAEPASIAVASPIRQSCCAADYV